MIGEDVYSPLKTAVLAKDVEEVRALIKAGVDVNERGNHDPPIMFALEPDMVPILRLLLDAGAEVTRCGRKPPLHLAAGRGHLEVGRMLVAAGAKLNAQSRRGTTALITAVRCRKLAFAEMLLDAGANINAEDHYGTTPFFKCAEIADAPILKLLLKRGVDPNTVTGHHEHSAIQLAIMNGKNDLEFMRTMFAAGASLMHTNWFGETVFHQAAVRMGEIGDRMVCYVLAHLPDGVNLDEMTQRTRGQTPLHYAVSDRATTNLRAITAFLARGHNPDATRDDDGNTPRQKAEANGKVDIVDLFERHRTRPFTFDDIPEAFIPLLTENPLWRLDTMVAMWATRKWGCGKAMQASGASDTADGGGGSADGDAASGGSDAAKGVGDADSAGPDAGPAGGSAGAGPGDASSGSAAAAASGGSASTAADAHGHDAESAAEHSSESKGQEGAAGVVDSRADELAPQPYNVGLPQKVLFWQSMPRNVVAIVAELTCDFSGLS